MANSNEQGKSEPLDATLTLMQSGKTPRNEESPPPPAPIGYQSKLAPGTSGALDKASQAHELTQTMSGPGVPIERRVPRIGELIGGEDGQRFALIEQLGAGSMGVVFLASDRILDRTVAIKFIIPGLRRSADSTPSELVRIEARATAKLSHENIVRIFDVGVHERIPFQVMEYLEGRLLSSAISYGELDTLKATRVMIDIARGLAHAHQFGVIHRDLKPANIFLVKGGRAKILDLGVAQMAVDLTRKDKRSPAIAGTPLYMSPEQWRGGQQDGRTDIWAAGTIFFQLLTGQLPFAGPGGTEDIRARVLASTPAPLLRSLRPDLPAEAERIIERALQKEPARRFGSAEELLDALVGLEVALTHGIRATEHELRQPSLTRVKPERRQMTLLSCALADLTPLSERMGMDDYSELLASFFEICSTIIEQLEGTLVSALGGRVMASFGYPIAHEDDAQRALRAALLIRGVITGLGGDGEDALAVQLGIHTGMAIAARPLGPNQAEPPFIQGEVPHVATWLEQRAGRGEILISQATQRLTQGFFEFQPLGPAAPGTRPLELYHVLRPRDVSSRFERAASELTPLVGRGAETDQLQSLWELARQGQGQLLLVSGEAGIGKSRLTELLKERVAAESGTRVTCQCWSQFRNSALYPLADGLQRLMGMDPEMGTPDKRARLEATLSSLGLPADVHLPLLASFLSIPLPEVQAQPSPEAYKRGLLESLSSLLLGLAARTPTLLVVEDLHWSDGLTLELLDLVFQRMTAARLLVVLTSRPEFQPPWAERAHLRRIALQRLSSRETAAMVSLSAHGQSLPAELIEHLVRRTDGIPLFVEELARIVSAAWNAAQARGESTTVEAFTSQVIPSTINELLLARLDCLSVAGREVARLGAVIGREFTYNLIQSASHLDEETLRLGLLQVVESGLVRYQGKDPDARYVFKHALVQDAAYQSLARSERNQHHLRVAKALIGGFPAVAEAQPELVAHHLLETGDNEQALGWLEKAGQRAAQRSAHADAVTHYARALLLLKVLPASPQRDRQELSIQLAYGAPLMSTRGYAAPEVHETYARARELCRLAGDDAQLFPSVLGLWQFYMVGGEAQVSAELGRQLLAQAESSGDPTMLMLAHRALGTSLMLLGELTSCREHTEKGLLLYDREKHGKLALRFGQDPGVTNGLYLGWSLWFLGHADQGVKRAQEALALARALEQPLSIAFALNYLATIHNYRGEHDTARELAEEANAISSEHRLALWLAMSKIQRGWSLMGKGQLDGADLLKEGVTGWQKTGAAAGLTFFLSALIWSLWQAGRLDEAMRTLEQMEVLVSTKGERFFEAELLRLRGELTLASGPGGERAAEDCFRRGLEVARRQQAKSWELRLATSLGSLLERQGRAAEAGELLRPLYAWFTEGLETADLQKAREVLARLG